MQSHFNCGRVIIKISLYPEQEKWLQTFMFADIFCHWLSMYVASKSGQHHKNNNNYPLILRLYYTVPGLILLCIG